MDAKNTPTDTTSNKSNTSSQQLCLPITELSTKPTTKKRKASSYKCHYKGCNVSGDLVRSGGFPLYDLSILKKHYNVEKNWTGSLNCAISLDWHYGEGYLDISIPNYVAEQLARYKQPPPRLPQHCPYEPNPVHYGEKSDEIVPEKPRSPSRRRKEICSTSCG